MRQQAGKSREIFFEHLRLGNYHKVVAVDGMTGIEVTIMGPAGTDQKRLESVALRKLKMRLEKDK